MTTHAEDQEQAEVPAEDHATGTWGHPPSPPVRLPEHITPSTPDEQAQRQAELSNALCGFAVGVALRRFKRHA